MVTRETILFAAQAHRDPVLDRKLGVHFGLRTAPHPSAEGLIAAGQSVVAIVASSADLPEQIGERVLDGIPSVRILAARGSGADAFDAEAARRRGIPILHNPGIASDAVVEWVVGVMPLLYRRFFSKAQAFRAGHWGIRSSLDPQLAGATVGVLGLGEIGTAVARRCRHAYDVRVVTYHPRLTATEATRRGAELLESLDSLMRMADVVVVATPLTPETRGLVTDRQLNLLKPSSVIIDVARGGVVDERALIRAIQDRRIAGAAMDVYEAEPPSVDNPLFDLDNVFLTPHCAGISLEARSRLTDSTARNLLRALRGERPDRLVDESCWPPRRLPPGDSSILG
jgi:D-3-phosphoglycerate dehydrogenase